MERNEEQAQAARTALFQEISQFIAEKTGLELSPELIGELLGEVQREELKRLVYEAFMAVQQQRMAVKEVASGEEPLNEVK
jgi:hypothetical protein